MEARMRQFLIAGVIVLASTASSAQTQLSTPTEPVNITFVKAQLGDALSFIAKAGAITIEFDATVTEEIQRAPLSEETIRIVNATVEEALGMLTSMNGLTYTVTGPRAIRISKKA
jgi:hypothetical protein